METPKRLEVEEVTELEADGTVSGSYLVYNSLEALLRRPLAPRVAPDDDGLRPSIHPGECFYCQRKIGERHKLSCVCLQAKVRYKVTAALALGIGAPLRKGIYDTYDPWAWFQNGDSGDPELDDLSGLWHFARNEGTWCAGNAEDAIKWQEEDTAGLLEEAVERAGHDCPCSFLEFELETVLDNRIHVTKPRPRVSAPSVSFERGDEEL